MIFQIMCPFRLIVSQHGTAGFRDQTAAANVTIGFTIRDVNDDLMDCPPIRRGPELPHLAWKTFQTIDQGLICRSIRLNFLAAYVRVHWWFSVNRRGLSAVDRLVEQEQTAA